MRGQLLDVKQHQSVGVKNLFRGQEGEVREMLVVDRVKLILLHQFQQVRELEGQHPPGLSRTFIPATKSQRSGTWARTLLPTSRSACFPCEANSVASCFPKNFTSVGTFFASAILATLAAGSMPNTGMFFCTKYCSR